MLQESYVKWLIVELKRSKSCKQTHTQSQQKKHQEKVGNMLKVNNNSSDVFIVSFEHISHLFLMLLLLILNR